MSHKIRPSTLMQGQRLLPTLLDEIARTDPKRIIYSVPHTNNPAEGFRDIDMHDFARAVNRCCHFLVKQLGHGVNQPTLTYMGPQDLVYVILILATVKTGYRLLMTSPRNPLEAEVSLLDRTNCQTFLLPANFRPPIVKQVLKERDMRVVETPSQHHWFEDGDEELYPYKKSFKSAKYEPLAVLHTSGSTGLPKPITMTHATCSPIDAQNTLPEPVYPSIIKGERAWQAFPLFHAAGVLLSLVAPIYCEYTCVLGPYPPSAEIANGMHLYANVQRSIVAPTTLIEIAKTPVYMEGLSRLRHLNFGGGPLPPNIGEAISRKVHLNTCLGTTEAGILPSLQTDREDWQYFNYASQLGAEYRHVSGDLYEQVIVRDQHLTEFQAVFGTFPDLQEWPMQDLYSKHPTKPNLWSYRGRLDDMIVFSNGEKLNPLAMENIVNCNPLVKHALVAGAGEFQSSLLIEPTKHPLDNTELESIWKSVQEANKLSPSHGRIHRNMMTFTVPAKAMLTSGKGTVQRRLTLDLYHTQLKQLYLQQGYARTARKESHDSGCGDVLSSVKRILSQTSDIDLQACQVKTNLFELGLDSLQVTSIARELNNWLLQMGSQKNIGPRSIYLNPTIEGLTDHVVGLVEGRVVVDESSSELLKMQATYDQLRQSLPISRLATAEDENSEVILLTGSTGSLGSYVLHTLVTDSRVSEIYCLNRGINSETRQRESFASRGFAASLQGVHFLDVNYSLDLFGVALQKYQEMLSKVTKVIHSAWQVNWHLDFHSFTEQLQTVRQLIDFSARSKFGSHIFFISSVAAVINFKKATHNAVDVSEQIFHDWSISQNAGYGQSKLVAERLLDSAFHEAGIQVTICRLGQIAGPTSIEGEWPQSEWLASVIASSKYLRKLPIDLGAMDNIDWVPVDKAAAVIRDLTISTIGSNVGRIPGPQSGPTVYHLVNPVSTNWLAIAPAVRDRLQSSSGTPVEIVPFHDWLESLRQSAASSEDLQANPALKILDILEIWTAEDALPIKLRTENTVQASDTLAKLGPITGELMQNWMTQWERVVTMRGS